MTTEQEERSFSGGKARQGDIILRTPARRFIFIVGLVGFVLLAAALAIFVP
jgi:hypothetical protein